MYKLHQLKTSRNSCYLVLEAFDFTGPENSPILKVFSKTDTLFTPDLFFLFQIRQCSLGLSARHLRKD